MQTRWVIVGAGFAGAATAWALARAGPPVADLPIRRSWACLLTFARDRRPLIGPDPEIPGLFHVSALGGFGVTCSAAIGELAAELLQGHRVDWIDTSAIAPARVLT